MTLPAKVIRVDDRHVSYREAGHGDVAILAPGLGLTSRFYERSLPAFASAGLRLVLPDLPGSGRTPGRMLGDDPAATMRFLITFATSLGVRNAVWIGHSLGAQVAAELAAERPDLARAIVLVGPTGAPGRVPRLRQVWGLTVEARRAGIPVLGAVARDYVRASPIRYLGTWLKHIDSRLFDVIPRVQCPILVLAGDADPLCRPEYIALLAARNARTRVAIVPGGTHALPRGDTAAFDREIIRFVRELSV